MATVVGGNRVKLNNGQVIEAQTGGWYDGQQFWNGSLSTAGQINSQSNQQGAGQMVSAEVNAQSAKAQGTTPQAFESYLQTQRQQAPRGQAVVQNQGASPTQIAGSNATAGTGVGVTAPTTIDLPGLYQSLTENSGISDLQTKLSDQEKQYIDTVGQVNDNPFLSEATRVGRVAKVDELFQKRTANLRDEIATQKADIETQLNLQMKQYDINSQASQQALQQFQVLLQSGALDNASGEDIANLTRSTGVSSSMIYSAIDASKKSKEVKPEMISFDDGTNQGFVLVDPNTGQILSKQVVGSSKPSAGREPSQYETEQSIKSQLIEDIRSGIPLVEYSGKGNDIMSIYSAWLDPNMIYSIYNSNSPYGAAKEDPADLVKYGVKDNS